VVHCVNTIMLYLYVLTLTQYLSGLDAGALAGLAAQPAAESADLRDSQRHLSQVRSNVRICANIDGRVLSGPCALRPCGRGV